MRAVRLLPLALLVACRTRAAPEPLLVEWAGCAAFLAGGECELDGPAELTAWLGAAASATITVTADQRPLAFASTPAGAGRRLRLAPPEHTAQLTLEVRAAEQRARAALALRWTQGATLSADRKRARQSFAEARSRIRRGDAEGALGAYERAAEEAEQERSLRVRAAIGAAYVLASFKGEVSAARAGLERAGAPAAADAHSRALQAYQRGVLARLGGDHREAVRAQSAAADLSARLALPLSPLIDNERALALLDLGQGEAALEILRGLLADPQISGDPCHRADVAVNAAWAALTAGAGPHRREVEGWLALALELRRGACKDLMRENNALVNLALLQLTQGELERAAATLAQVHGAEQPDAHGWRRAIEARLALARGQLSQAEAGFLALPEHAALTSLEDLEWMAALYLGRTREAAGALPGAIAAYRQAEEILERQSLLFPLDRGRLLFLDSRAESQERLAAALLRAGEPEQAFDARRRARRRALIALAFDHGSALTGQARPPAFADRYARYRRARAELDQATGGAWQDSLADRTGSRARREALARAAREALDDALAVLVPQERAALARAPLRRPGPGELFVAAFPRQAGFELWAQSAAGTRVHPTEARPDARAAVRLLRGELEAAGRIVVFAGEIALDLHAVPHGDRPLGAEKSVVYSLDLPPRPPRPRGARALVVADPRGDLDWAREEGAQVERALGAGGFEVTTLTTRAAVVEAARREAARADRLHYAGHAEAGGDEGFEAALLLADGTWTAGDVATSSAAPAEVVLTGCEAGADRSGKLTAGVGLARAFTLAGADVVIAVPDRVADKLARDFALTLYRGGPAGEGLEAAYRRALGALPAAGALAFRVSVR